MYALSTLFKFILLTTAENDVTIDEIESILCMTWKQITVLDPYKRYFLNALVIGYVSGMTSLWYEIISSLDYWSSQMISEKMLI